MNKYTVHGTRERAYLYRSVCRNPSTCTWFTRTCRYVQWVVCVVWTNLPDNYFKGWCTFK